MCRTCSLAGATFCLSYKYTKRLEQPLYKLKYADFPVVCQLAIHHIWLICGVFLLLPNLLAYISSLSVRFLWCQRTIIFAIPEPLRSILYCAIYCANSLKLIWIYINIHLPKQFSNSFISKDLRRFIDLYETISKSPTDFDT